MKAKPRKPRKAFTLIEMAVVIIVIGLIMLTVFPALRAVQSANQRAVTEANLKSLMQATAVFVQANGCLPCPTPPTAAPDQFGRVGIAGNNAGNCGVCPASAAKGIPPYIALGLPMGTAHDGWGHWITMQVDPALTNPASANLQQGLCMISSTKSANPIFVSTPGINTAQQVAVIFVSHGAHGYGSYIINPQSLTGSVQTMQFPADGSYPPCASNGAAQCNADGNGQYVDGIPGDTYDDLMLYTGRDALVGMFNSTACQTPWLPAKQ